jgi:hypothetical protein
VNIIELKSLRKHNIYSVQSFMMERGGRDLNVGDEASHWNMLINKDNEGVNANCIGLRPLCNYI